MAYVGIDLHKKESQICLVDADGTIVKEARIPSRRKELTEAARSWPPRSRVVLESSTSSEWVARTLENEGQTVVVADPNYAPMMGSKRKRKIKTDRRDALALAESSRLGAYRPANRMSDEDRKVRGQLAVRAALVSTRTTLINLARASILQYQEPAESCSAEAFVKTIRAMPLPEALQTILAPALGVLEQLNAVLEKQEGEIEAIGKRTPGAKRLMTIGGVGPITSLMFLAVIGRAERFASAGHASAFLGLVPGEASSGEGVTRTRITKTGNAYLRALLVQCAWSVMRSKSGGGLKQWALRLAEKRTKKVAAVALARRLARIMWAMLKNETDFDPTMHKPRKLEVSVREVFDPEALVPRPSRRVKIPVCS